MKLGIIARAEDRGLGIQTLEACRALNPTRVLLIEPRPARWPLHTERYAQWDTTVLPWGGELDEDRLCRWASGLDVIYTAETLYDWRLPQLCRAGIVCHANPEMLASRDADVIGVTWWSATPWRLDHLPEGARVVPMPVAADRFTPTTNTGPVRFLHVGGHAAMKDRNGTRVVADAAKRVNVPCEITITTQDPAAANVANPNPGVTTSYKRVDVPNYWDLYTGHDVLLMPRRYGGLCLPVQEAMAAGLAVVMTDISPNEVWPGPKIRTTGSFHVSMAGGTVDVAEPDTSHLVSIINDLADRERLAPHQAEALAWADTHSWEALAPIWLEELERVARCPRPTTLRRTRTKRKARPPISVVAPARLDDEHRRAAWAWVRARYEDRYPRWQIVEGTCTGPWSKGAALADGLARANGDIVIVTDADVWCDDIGTAVDAIVNGSGWAIPHRDVHRLNPEQTRDVLDGADPAAAGHNLRALDRRAYKGMPGGGLVVARAQTIRDVPIDPRFYGWALEDHAWGNALQTLVGRPWRGETPLWHLWHPHIGPAERNRGDEDAEQLRRRYVRAWRQPRQMRALIDEAVAELATIGGR